jgi:hypothetical protein
MAKGACPYRTPGPLLAIQPAAGDPQIPSLLGYSGLLIGTSGSLPGVGIQSGPVVLVYQRDDLPGKEPGKLVPKDEGLQKMRNFFAGREGEIASGARKTTSGRDFIREKKRG